MTQRIVSRREFVHCGAAATLLTLFAKAETTAKASETEWLKPKGLKQGDTIALVAPAGPADRAVVLSYKQQLEQGGFRVQYDERMLDRKKEYLAGDDNERVAELNNAIRDPLVRAIFPVRGGYGLTRILDRIDYASLRSDPKIITGYSDLTALHLAIARKSRVISFHSPMPMSNLAQGHLPEHVYSQRSFERMLFADRFPKPMAGEAIEVPTTDPIETIHRGKTQGRLMGGNLTLVCATMGTPYAIEATGAILFLEDVNEAPYRVDRLLSQLRLAGILDSVAGIVLGQFTNKDPNDAKDIDRVVTEVMKQVRCPVIANFPVGHVPKNATLPHGALLELDANRGALTLLEEPCLR
jgi:muramoyltetrapeptide carboxypeptidase